jgi:hypothetical protein
MGTEQARRLTHRPTPAYGQGHGQALEHENAQLRKVVADLTLDNTILKESVRGK